MARTTLNEMKTRCLEQMSAAQRAEFDATYAATKLALEVGEQVRDARETAGLSQRELASRMGTSQGGDRPSGSRRRGGHAHDTPEGRDRAPTRGVSPSPPGELTASRADAALTGERSPVDR